MEILNDLPEEQYLALDAFLSILSIYEDRVRTRRLQRALRSLLQPHWVVLEAGAGLGHMTAYLARQVRRVYAVEENPLACRFLHQRFQRHPRVRILCGMVETVTPPEPVDLLFQELYGPLLYDESLAALEQLAFRPAYVFPNAGALEYGLLDSRRLRDPVVRPEILPLLEGALVADLVPEVRFRPLGTLCTWHWPEGLRCGTAHLKDHTGDLVALRLVVLHEGKVLCRAQECPNWPLVFAYRAGDRFRLQFTYAEATSRVELEWLP